MTFLSSWIDFAGSENETPLNFHYATGMSLLSFLVGQRVIVRTSNAEPLTTRINSVLIGKSGVGKRISMLDWGYQLLTRVAGKLPSEMGIDIKEDIFVQGSNSALLRFIINRCGGGRKGLILAEEISSILGARGNYTEGVGTTLAQGLDDSPFASVDFHSWKEKSDEGKKGWETRCERPFAVGIFGSTEAWLRDAMDGRAAVAGLPGRMLWVIGNRREEAKPFGKARTEQEWKEIVDEFLACVNVEEGEIVVSEFEGRLRDAYEDFYQTFNRRLSQDWISPLMEGWVSRLNIWVLRVAAIFSVNCRRGIQVEDMEEAISYLEGLEKPMEKVLHGLSADETHSASRWVIMQCMRNWREKTGQEFMSRTDIRRETQFVFQNDNQGFEQTMKALKEQGMIAWQQAAKGWVLMEEGE